MDIDTARAKLPELLDDPDERIAALARLAALLLDERDEADALWDNEQTAHEARLPKVM